VATLENQAILVIAATPERLDTPATADRALVVTVAIRAILDLPVTLVIREHRVIVVTPVAGSAVTLAIADIVELPAIRATAVTPVFLATVDTPDLACQVTLAIPATADRVAILDTVELGSLVIRATPVFQDILVTLGLRDTLATAATPVLVLAATLAIVELPAIRATVGLAVTRATLVLASVATLVIVEQAATLVTLASVATLVIVEQAATLVTVAILGSRATLATADIAERLDTLATPVPVLVVTLVTPVFPVFQVRMPPLAAAVTQAIPVFLDTLAILE